MNNRFDTCSHCGRIYDPNYEGHCHIGPGCCDATGCQICKSDEMEQALEEKCFCCQECECSYLQTNNLERFLADNIPVE